MGINNPNFLGVGKKLRVDVKIGRSIEISEIS